MMNLLINKFLDKKIPCGITKGLKGFIDKPVFENLARIASQAELFDFGQLPLERHNSEERVDGSQVIDSVYFYGAITADTLDGQVPDLYRIPSLTPQEQEWYDLGLIPMPAPYCVFEFRLRNRSSLIIDATDPKHMRVTRIDEQLADGMWMYSIPSDNDGRRQYAMVSVNPLDIEVMREHTKYLERSSIMSHVELAKYMALMLNSRTTEVRPSEPPPPKLISARLKNRRSPLRPYHIVNIVPKQYIRATGGEAHVGLGAHKALHWRRSHLRRYEHATPRAVYLDSGLDGHLARVAGYYVVIPRQLIGRRDMGELVQEHTYRVTVKPKGV